MTERFLFPLHFTRDMSDDECIALAMLYGLEPYMYAARHSSRNHPIWYLQKFRVDGTLETPVEKWMGRLTARSGEPRYYFVSCAEACRAACEFYGWSLQEVTP